MTNGYGQYVEAGLFMNPEGHAGTRPRTSGMSCFSESPLVTTLKPEREAGHFASALNSMVTSDHRAPALTLSAELSGSYLVVEPACLQSSSALIMGVEVRHAKRPLLDSWSTALLNISAGLALAEISAVMAILPLSPVLCEHNLLFEGPRPLADFAFPDTSIHVVPESLAAADRVAEEAAQRMDEAAASHADDWQFVND